MRSDVTTTEQLGDPARIAAITIETYEMFAWRDIREYVKCEYVIEDMKPVIDKHDYIKVHVTCKTMLSKRRTKFIEVVGDFTMHELNILTYMFRCKEDFMYIRDYLAGKPTTIRKIVDA